MIDDSPNRKQKRQAEMETERSKQLLFGKAVLLIGNDTAVLQDLVAKLAKKGADIALLCWQMPVEIARKMEEYVQSFGRRLILIERAENQRFSLQQLIHHIITTWGEFDIFIDVTTRSRTAVQTKAGEKSRPHSGWLPSKWELTRTVLEEMAHA